jgi:hypothetical protein
MSPPSDGGQAHKRLAASTLAMVPRIADSLSFPYLDMVCVVQGCSGADGGQGDGLPALLADAGVFRACRGHMRQGSSLPADAGGG